MRREQKVEAIAELARRLRQSETVFATNFRGLSVTQINDLRRRLREAEADFTVVKNTLTRRAASESGREELLAYLDGPTAIAWVRGDAALAAKAITQFAAQHPDGLSVKGGLLEGADLPAADIVRLGKLPPREELHGRLANGVASPLSGLAGGLSNLMGGLARSLGALQAQRASEAPAEG